MLVTSGISVFGNVTIDEVTEALKKYFPYKTISITNENELSPRNDNDIFVSQTSVSSDVSELKSQLEVKSLKLKEMELSSSKALLSIQTFHRQQQSLFDEFVLLRQKYDDQKTSLLNILWVHCGAYHPELTQIPDIENEDTFIETDSQIGTYIVGEMLGEGQFATVKTCWNKEDREGLHEYALKMIKKERIASFSSLRRVSNEIDILKKLHSQYVVTVSDVIQTKNMLYILTEKGGSDLFEFFDEHPNGVPEKWAKDIIASILKAVTYVHAQDICHRDLKPENILLSFDNESEKCLDLKLCDFGLSTKFTHNVELFDFCGSPGFFAPEMITKGSYFGDKADVWSIGCILLELVFGHERFCDFWMTAYDYEVLQDKHRFTDEIRDTVSRLPDNLNFSDSLNDFILSFLRLHSSDRPITKQLCNHNWLEGFIEVSSSPIGIKFENSSPIESPRESNSHTPKSQSEGINNRLGNLEIDIRSRNMLETDSNFHLPPIEPATPSVIRARKYLPQTSPIPTTTLLKNNGNFSPMQNGGGEYKNGALFKNGLSPNHNGLATHGSHGHSACILDSVEEHTSSDLMSTSSEISSVGNLISSNSEGGFKK
jgi:serine/threonine protein kinase